MLFDSIKNKKFHTSLALRLAGISAAAVLLMAGAWHMNPLQEEESTWPQEPSISARASMVAIGGSAVSSAQVQNLRTRSTVASLSGDPQMVLDQYRRTQLESFAVQGWQGIPYLVSYASSDESVCTVDENGLVTALTPGTATITATATDAENHTVSGTCLVQVNEALPPIDALRLNRTSVKLRMGGTGSNLKVSYEPEDFDGILPPLVFSSSDESICTVDENGHITAVAEGEAVVTAAVGPITATCAVTVEPRVVVQPPVATAQTPAATTQTQAGTKQSSQMKEVSGIHLLNFDHSMIAGIGNQTPGRCSLFCLRYARTILDGTPCSGSGMWSNGANWSAGGYRNFSGDRDTCLNKLYSELGAGRPVIVHLQNAPGENICTTYEYWENGSGWKKTRYPHRATSSQYGHWVLVAGVSADADPSNLRESDFFALDPAHVTDGSRICVTRLMDNTMWVDNSPLKVTG